MVVTAIGAARLRLPPMAHRKAPPTLSRGALGGASGPTASPTPPPISLITLFLHDINLV